jgi:hypothetical protein
VLDRLTVSTEANAADEPTSGGRVLGGARLGADLRAWLAPSFGLFAGANAQWLAGTTDVRVDGNAAGTATALAYSGIAGVSFGWR